MVKRSIYVGFFRHYQLRETSLLKNKKTIYNKIQIKKFVYFNNCVRYSI